MAFEVKEKKACFRWTMTSGLRNEGEGMFTLDSDEWPS